MPDNDYNEPTRILAIDYGLKRVGLALSDPLRIFAYPFKTLINDNTFWKELKKVLEEKNVETIILGFPTNEGGSKSHITEQVKKFAENLEQKFKTGVILWDERYTSVMAREKILESVTKKSKRRDKGLLDQNSAAIMLQEYLNSLN